MGSEMCIRDSLSVDQSLYYLQMILKGVDFLHENGVLHLNINCKHFLYSFIDVSNKILIVHTAAQTVLLFDEGRVVKLSDFSTAVSISNISEKGSTDGRLIYCAAPEVIQEDQPSPSSDIWSAMCTMVQMLTSRNPGCHRGYRRPMAMMLLVSWDYKAPSITLPLKPCTLGGVQNFLSMCMFFPGIGLLASRLSLVWFYR